MSSNEADNSLKKREILIVDDDPGQRSLLTTFLTSQGFQPTTVDSGEAALAQLEEGPFKMMISDVRMPGISGLETLRRARSLHPTLPVLLVTAFADVKDAVGAMRDGAVNYLEKPIDLDELHDSVRRALGDNKPKVQESIEFELPPEIVADGSASQQVFKDVLLVAPSESRVLINGESGVGKRTVANLLHEKSSRAGHPCHSVNCAAVGPEAIDALLFGSSNENGMFTKCDQGTLILEEIGELPLGTQARLLTVTQSGTFHREGAVQEERSEARIIGTTKSDLTSEVEAGRFRDDLFFRLNVMEIFIPPLRERREDVMPLATHFIKQYTQGHARFAPTVRPCLENHDWPGNIRELRNAMERATLMAHGGIILPKHLPNKVQAAAKSDEGGEASQARKMVDVERETILQTLRDNRNNRSVTARVLGISRRALTYKLQRYREDGYLSD